MRELGACGAGRPNPPYSGGCCGGIGSHDQACCSLHRPDPRPRNPPLPLYAGCPGHDRVDVVKVDVEGGEWDVLESLQRSSAIERVGQLVRACSEPCAGAVPR